MNATKYRVGLVLSQAGMNGAQWADVKERLKFIAKVAGTGNGGIEVTVPGLHHKGPAGARDAEALLEPFQRMGHVAAVVAEDVRSAAECVRLFVDHDEVWCVPAPGQTILTRARAWQVFTLGQQQHHGQRRKYKIIPPWTEAPAVDSKEIKPKALKG